MLDLKPWRVIDNAAQNFVVLAGEPVGKQVNIRCVIEWEISDSDKAKILQVNEVKCLDGVHGFDPYAVVNELSIVADGRRVTFEASVFSYRRNITFRVGIITGFDSGIPHRAFVCKDLVLDIQPGPEPVNPKWEMVVGDLVYSKWATTALKCDRKASDPVFTFQNEQWMYSTPLTGDVSVDIARRKPFHDHATDDLKPRVSCRLLDDGTGLVVTPENLRPYERYVVTVRAGNQYTIYLRTHGD